MNKDKFLSLNSKQRVEFVNELLQSNSYDLRQVSDYLGINYSTFTKVMQEDCYVYIKRDNRYFKFVRDERQLKTDNTIEDEATQFLRENLEQLKVVVEKHTANDDFTIDKSIFKSSAKQVTKTFRIHEDLYQKFVDTCEMEFPHLKLQNIIGQLLLDFTNKYYKND